MHLKKIQNQNNNQSGKFKNINRFMNLINNENKLGKADIFREVGLFFELEQNLQVAYEYMEYAKKIRPNGSFIIKKVDEYKSKLSDEIINDFTINDEKLKNINRLHNMVNTNKLKKPDVYREIALLCEQYSNIELASKYMGYAKELRPNGKFIVNKFNKYKEKLNK